MSPDNRYQFRPHSTPRADEEKLNQWRDEGPEPTERDLGPLAFLATTVIVIFGYLIYRVISTG